MSRRPLRFPIKSDFSLDDFSYYFDEAYYDYKKDEHLPQEILSSKDNEVARDFLRRGKMNFRNQKYLEAIKDFTVALQYAEYNSEVITVAHAKRSQVLFRVGLFRECLEDIKLTVGIPEHKKMDIELRRREAEDRIREQKPGVRKTYVIPEAEQNEKNKYFKKSVKVISRATSVEEIKSGEIIAVEEAHVVAPNNLDTVLYCSHCLITTANPLPCIHCTKVRYCTDACREVAWNLYHIHECKIIDMLEPEYKYYGLLVRLIFSLYYHALQQEQNHTRGIEDMQKVLRMSIVYQHTRLSSQDIELLNDRRIPYEQMNSADRKQVERHATNFYHLVEKYTRFFDEWTCKRTAQTTIKGLILELLYICRDNSWTEKSFKRVGDGIVLPLEWQSLFLYHDSFKHSCVPNVFTTSVGTTKYTIALENIREDTDLTECLSTPFYRAEKQERMKLLENYAMTCNCVACNKHWPVLKFIRSRNKEIYEEIKEMRAQLKESTGNMNLLRECIRRLNEMAEKVKTEPSREYIYRLLILIEYSHHQICLEWYDPIDDMIDRYHDEKYYLFSESFSKEESEDEDEYVPGWVYMEEEVIKDWSACSPDKVDIVDEESEEEGVYIPAKVNRGTEEEGEYISGREDKVEEETEEEGEYIPGREDKVDEESEEEGEYIPGREDKVDEESEEEGEYIPGIEEKVDEETEEEGEYIPGREDKVDEKTEEKGEYNPDKEERVGEENKDEGEHIRHEEERVGEGNEEGREHIRDEGDKVNEVTEEDGKRVPDKEEVCEETERDRLERAWRREENNRLSRVLAAIRMQELQELQELCPSKS